MKRQLTSNKPRRGFHALSKGFSPPRKGLPHAERGFSPQLN